MNRMLIFRSAVAWKSSGAKIPASRAIWTMSVIQPADRAAGRGLLDRLAPLVHAGLDVRDDLLLVLLAGVDDLEDQDGLFGAGSLDGLDRLLGIDAAGLVRLRRER